MADTNGFVAPEHLTTFNGVPVSKLIYPRLLAASLDFHRQGYTFSLARPGGGERPFDMQGAIQAAFDRHEFGVPPYYLNGASSSRPANAGHSRHGFGLAMDIVTNAPTAKRNQILAAHGIHLWSTTDPNHFEPDGINVLVAPPESAFAGLDSSPIGADPAADPTIGDLMSLLPAAFHIQNTDAQGNPTQDGLSGVEVVLAESCCFVSPGVKGWAGAMSQVVAPYLNNAVLTPGGKINATANGALLTISQQNIDILLHVLGYPDGKLEEIGQAGGGLFYPIGSAGVDQVALSATLTAAVQAAIKASPMDVDEKALAAVLAPALDAALADNFTALPDAIVKAEGAALSKA